jgi:hypothetical protein
MAGNTHVEFGPFWGIGKKPHIEGFPTADEDLARLSPLGYEHLNFLGRYTFALPEALQRGGYRPLRAPEDGLLDTIEGA